MCWPLAYEWKRGFAASGNCQIQDTSGIQEAEQAKLLPLLSTFPNQLPESSPQAISNTAFESQPKVLSKSGPDMSTSETVESVKTERAFGEALAKQTQIPKVFASQAKNDAPAPPLEDSLIAGTK